MNLLRRRLHWAAPLVCAAVLTGAMSPTASAAPDTDPPPAAAAAAAGPVAGDEITAAGGERLTLAAVNPASRLAGMVAVYTPAFGATTRTNAWGGEAVLRPAGDGRWTVESVCTALTACANPAWKAGDNAIPADGLVLSFSPGGTPDVRVWMRDNLRAGDVIRVGPVISRTAQTTVDAVDPTAENNPAGYDQANRTCFPGCRGAEQLVQYTSASGRERTATNDFGFEVTVRDGIVVGAGGNNRTIPADGYVLSGHGSRGTWLQTNAPVGAVIAIDGTTITATVDERAAIFGAESAIATARADIDAATASCLAFPADQATAAHTQAQDLVAQARTASDNGDGARAMELAGQSRVAAELAGYRTAESRTVEGRATWVRPEETTPAAIEATLDRMKSTGFNMIFLETIYQGYTIFPSDAAAAAGVAQQRPNMVGFDPLQVWIDGAHARGIEVHPWVHTFFVGSNQTGGVGPVLSAHPEWAAIQRQDVGKPGLHPSLAEEGYYFLDPAIPAARAYVQSLLAELMTDYDIDGIHLDYIRYPVSQPWQSAGYSYSDYSRQTFAAKHGVDPYTLTPDSPQWATWTQWRVDTITSFVGEVRAAQQQKAPTIALSAAVFADPKDGIDKKFQDWGAWVDKGYVDLLTGMSFGTSGESVARDTTVMRERVGRLNYLYTATYGPFRGSTPDIVLDQLGAVTDASSDGVGLFAYNQLSNEQAQALVEGAYRSPAIAPHSDPVRAVKAGIDSVRSAVTSAVSGGCVSAKTATQITTRLTTAQVLLDSANATAQAAAKAPRWLAPLFNALTGHLLSKASAELGSAVTAVGKPTATGPAAWAARTQRDLTMYQRWVDIAAK